MNTIKLNAAFSAVMATVFSFALVIQLMPVSALHGGAA